MDIIQGLKVVTAIMILMSIIVTLSGIPILILDACSESEATFTCTVNESTSLNWKIDFLSGKVVDRVTYLPTDPTGLNQLVTNEGTQSSVDYHFNLTSKSPLTSTMTTDTPTDLSGATIFCSEGVQTANDTAKMAFHKPPHPLNITVRALLVPEMLESAPIDGLLHWDIQDSDTVIVDVLNTSYIITVTPQSEKLNQLIFETSNTSAPLTLFLDQAYNISVVARNCIGTTSESAELYITWDGNCSIPWSNIKSANVSFEYTLNVGGPQLVYSCFPGFQHQREIASVCTSDGTWYPNPVDILCTYTNEDKDHGDNTDVTIIDDNIIITFNNGANSTNIDVSNTESDINEPVASTTVTVVFSVVFLFLVVLGLTTALFIMVWLHRRKQGSTSETQTEEQAQNEYTDVGHIHQYQDNDLDYSFSHVELGHSQRDNSTFTLISEIQNPLYQNVTNNHNPDDNLNLDSLLIQLRAQVSPKWHEFGTVIGVPGDLLDQYSSDPADERLIEVFNYWLNNHQTPTWRDMAKVLRDIELNELAEGIMNVYETGCLPIEIDADDSDSDDNTLLPLPLPSNLLSRIPT